MANQIVGKAASEIPALKPYRGKPAIRNFRGGNGNVGIIRSPVRAIALPDSRQTVPEATSALRFDAYSIVDGSTDPLFATQVSLRCLHGNVSEEKLNLLQFAASGVT